MAENKPTNAEVFEATHEDLVTILAWLKHEYDEDSRSGFWCNRPCISRALGERRSLWVIRRNGKAVAFQVGEYSAKILSVRKDYRRCGMATSLVEASIERAKKDDVNALSVQCKPERSIEFWKKMGFEEYSDPRHPDDLMVRRVLPRTYVLASNSSPVKVVIGFYPEAALYNRAEHIPPIAEHRAKGVHLDGSIILEGRVIGLCDDVSPGQDLAIKIEVNGVEHCFCKAKYAKDVGVQYDCSGGTFFIDCVKPKKGDG
jgi:GNAT superfamily N-acetyltransferase